MKGEEGAWAGAGEDMSVDLTDMMALVLFSQFVALNVVSMPVKVPFWFVNEDTIAVV